MRSNTTEISLCEPDYELVAKLEQNVVNLELVVYGKNRSDCKYYQRTLGYSKASSQYYMNTIFKSLSDSNLVTVYLQSGTIEVVYIREPQRQLKTIFTVILNEKPLPEQKILRTQSKSQIRCILKSQNKNEQKLLKQAYTSLNSNKTAQSRKQIIDVDDEDEDDYSYVPSKFDKPRKMVKKDTQSEKNKTLISRSVQRQWKICDKNASRFSITNKNRVKYEHGEEWSQIVRNKKLRRREGPTSQFSFQIISTLQGKIAVGVVSQKRLGASSSFEKILAVSQVGFGMFKVPSRVKVVIKWQENSIEWVVKNEKTKVWVIANSFDFLGGSAIYPYIEMYDKDDIVQWVENEEE